MKHLGGLLFLAIIAASLLAPGRPVSAQIPEYNNQLKVTGIILPAQHVIVNEHGMITEILSNTDKDVVPKVYISKLSKDTVIEMTPEIYDQYRQLVPEGQSRVGVLYKQTPGIYPVVPLDSFMPNESYRLTSPILNDI
jgi:hypothetical protein